MIPRVMVLAAGGVAAIVAIVLADTILVPKVELREGPNAEYILEATVARVLLGAVAAPTPPSRCRLDPERTVTDQGSNFLVRYLIDCQGQPLTVNDELVLPWAVDGVQLTVIWAGDEERRGLFGRESAGGVVIRMALLLSQAHDPVDVALTHFVSGLRHAATGWGHIVLIVGLALFIRLRGIVLVLAGFSVGQAGAMVLVELGGIGLPSGPAEAAVAGAAVAFAGAFLVGREPGSPVDTGRNWFVTAVVLGVVHGLGAATTLQENGLAGMSLVIALFGSNVGTDVAHWSVGMALCTAVARLRLSAGVHSMLPRVMGTVGAAVMLSTLVASLQSPARMGGPPGFLRTAAPTDGSSGAIPTQLTSAGTLAADFIGYVMVEPYQVRLEVLAAATAVDHRQPQEVDIASTLGEQAVDLLAATTVFIDGTPVPVASAVANYVTIGPTGVMIIGDSVPPIMEDAVLGVTLLYETDGMPDLIDIEWSVFSGGSAVPISIRDPSTTTEVTVTADNPQILWHNTLGEVSLPTVRSIEAEAPRLPVLSLAALILAGALFAKSPTVRARRTALALAFALTGYFAYPFARVNAEIPLLAETSVREDQARDVLQRLLTNVYRSFDIHSEEAIYDRLALTVTGDQLLDVYLESRRALELENRGGARVRIDDVSVREVRSVERTSTGFLIDAVWVVGGSVSHFGHDHFRQNRYDAVVQVVPVDGVWKINGVEIREENRLL